MSGRYCFTGKEAVFGKIILEMFGYSNKKPYLCRAFMQKHYLLTYLTYYEPIRNRFHFDSRFV